MLPKSAFQRIGGFDSRYVPAYVRRHRSGFQRASGRIQKSALSTAQRGVPFRRERPVALTYRRARRSIRKLTEERSQRSGRKLSPPNLPTATLLRWNNSRKGINVFLLSTILCPCRTGTPVRFACFRSSRSSHQLGHRVTFIPHNLAAHHISSLRERATKAWDRSLPAAARHGCYWRT